MQNETGQTNLRHLPVKECADIREKGSVLLQCCNCTKIYRLSPEAHSCPDCHSRNNNATIVFMEKDAEGGEWLDLVDFAASS